METNSEVLVGQIACGEYNDWYVMHEGSSYSLHPDDVNFITDMEQLFDDVKGRILSSPTTPFHIVKHQKLTGVATYAKLI